MLNNSAGWNLLTKEEQFVLKLNLGHDKSTWKAGEIMKKSHYKLIEIMDRGKTFLKMFTHHYAEYHKLIPEGVNISPDFRHYLELTILGRKNVHKAITEIDNLLYHRIESRDKIIISEMAAWQKSMRIAERDLYNLIMDFDRWNNFRILPKAIQEPSAFKRRNKNKLKKHLYIGTHLPPISYQVIKDIYEYKKNHKINEGYISIITQEPRRAEIIRIHATPENIGLFSKSSLYVFNSEEIATQYLSLTLNYIQKTDKHCIEGLRFWPKYRKLIQEAINYDKIQNIIPSRKNLQFIGIGPH